MSQPTFVTATNDIAASPSEVWALVTDLPRMGEWSPEATGGVWGKGATTPSLGATFKGTNARGGRSWSTTATVTTFDVDRTFAFDVKGGGMKVARWSYMLEPNETGTRVTERWDDTRKPLMKLIGKVVSGVGDRASYNLESMKTTLDNLARAFDR